MGRDARQAASNPWITLLARGGYAAKGIVYLIVGGLAAAAAFGVGSGATTDQRGAIQAIYQEPSGRFLLVVVAVGWLGYALWSEIQAALDTEHRGTNAQGIIVRVAYAVVGFTYASLAIAALRLVAGGGGGQSTNAQTQSWTARLLAHGWGVALVILVGLIILAIAGVLFYRAYSAEFRHSLHLGLPGGGAWVVWLGRLGYGALGVVFVVIGLFLIVAAVQRNPGQAKGFGAALQALERQPLGHLTLGVVALGLVCYGLYSVAEARFRRVGAS